MMYDDMMILFIVALYDDEFCILCMYMYYIYIDIYSMYDIYDDDDDDMMIIFV